MSKSTYTNIHEQPFCCGQPQITKSKKRACGETKKIQKEFTQGPSKDCVWTNKIKIGLQLFGKRSGQKN